MASYLKKIDTLSQEITMELKKINEFTWQIDKQGPMKVPAIIYASEKLLEINSSR